MKIIRNIVFTIFIILFAGSMLTFRALAQEEGAGELVLFVREGCPYCSIAEDFIIENVLEDKVQILDVEADEGAAALYDQLFDEANVPIQDRGNVPIMFDGTEYFEGADEIKLHLGEKFDISVDTELPPDGDEEKNKDIKVVLAIFGVAIVVAAVFFIISTKADK